MSTNSIPLLPGPQLTSVADPIAVVQNNQRKALKWRAPRIVRGLYRSAEKSLRAASDLRTHDLIHHMLYLDQKTLSELNSFSQDVTSAKADLDALLDEANKRMFPLFVLVTARSKAKAYRDLVYTYSDLVLTASARARDHHGLAQAGMLDVDETEAARRLEAAGIRYVHAKDVEEEEASTSTTELSGTDSPCSSATSTSTTQLLGTDSPCSSATTDSANDPPSQQYELELTEWQLRKDGQSPGSSDASSTLYRSAWSTMTGLTEFSKDVRIIDLSPVRPNFETASARSQTPPPED